MTKHLVVILLLLSIIIKLGYSSSDNQQQQQQQPANNNDNDNNRENYDESIERIQVDSCSGGVYLNSREVLIKGEKEERGSCIMAETQQDQALDASSTSMIRSHSQSEATKSSRTIKVLSHNVYGHYITMAPNKVSLFRSSSSRKVDSLLLKE